jgi:hypothetical protein
MMIALIGAIYLICGALAGGGNIDKVEGASNQSERVAIWHGCFNFIASPNAGNGMLAAVVSTLVMIWAVVVILLMLSG